jgi:tetratricopeptide (TPR) repeat protein
LADRGQLAEALALLDTISAAAKARSQPDPALAASHYARAMLLLAAGQAPAAQAAAQNALDLDRQLHHPPSVGDDHFLLGRIAAAQNKNQEAAHHYRRAVGIFANTGQQNRLAASRNALDQLAAKP